MMRISSVIPATSPSVAFALRVASSLRQDADHVVQGVVDPTREKRERADDEERDHSEDHAVLGHRLTLLLRQGRPNEVEPLGERHLGSPPFDQSKTAVVATGAGW